MVYTYISVYAYIPLSHLRVKEFIRVYFSYKLVVKDISRYLLPLMLIQLFIQSSLDLVGKAYGMTLTLLPVSTYNKAWWADGTNYSISLN